MSRGYSSISGDWSSGSSRWSGDNNKPSSSSSSRSSSSSSSSDRQRSDWERRQERNERHAEGNHANIDSSRESGKSNWVERKKKERESQSQRSETSVNRSNNHSFNLVDSTYNRKGNITSNSPKPNRTLLGSNGEDKDSNSLTQGGFLERRNHSYTENFSPVERTKEYQSPFEKDRNKGPMSRAVNISDERASELRRKAAQEYASRQDTRFGANKFGETIANVVTGGFYSPAKAGAQALMGAASTAASNAGNIYNELTENNVFEGLSGDERKYLEDEYQGLHAQAKEANNDFWGGAIKVAKHLPLPIVGTIAETIEHKRGMDAALNSSPEGREISAERLARMRAREEERAEKERLRGDGNQNMGILPNIRARLQPQPELNGDYGIPDLSHLWANYKVEYFK